MSMFFFLVVQRSVVSSKSLKNCWWLPLVVKWNLVRKSPILILYTAFEMRREFFSASANLSLKAIGFNLAQFI